MIPGMCNICRTTLFGNESRGHIARCVEARYDIRGIRASLKGRSRTVHISVGSPERPHWMELGVRADTTLHELDRFLRSVWLECCGHLSHFDIAGVVYSVMVPRPGDDFAFLPMDEREEQWRHMGRTVGTAIRPATWFEHQYMTTAPPPVWTSDTQESSRDWSRRSVRPSRGTVGRSSCLPGTTLCSRAACADARRSGGWFPLTTISWAPRTISTTTFSAG